MAILIVDDESNTRKALRDLLSLAGDSTILEAKHGKEALEILDAEKGRIHLIISDWEMPWMDGLKLVEEVDRRPDLDLAPFLLITSDLPASRLQEWRRQHHRLDGHLTKPFLGRTLERAILNAHLERLKSRNIAVLFGWDEAPPLGELWSETRRISDPAELATLLDHPPRALGILLMDPDLLDSVLTVELSRKIANFRKSPAGSGVPIVCLGRKPDLIQPLRTTARFFMNFPKSHEEWTALGDSVARHLKTDPEVAGMIRKMKSLVRDQKLAEAWKIAKQILSINPDNGETLQQAGELAERFGHAEQAIGFFTRAVEQNPCLPQTWLRLLPLLQAHHPHRIPEQAELATGCCPRHPEVRTVAESLLKPPAAGSR